MKKVLFGFALLLSVAMIGCCSAPKDMSVSTINNGLKFCEGTVAFGDDILVTNFGGDALNPLNTDAKGYVMRVCGDSCSVFIPSDGNLSAPKGMAIAAERLYIADVQKVVVYNLSDLAQAPQVIAMPEGNLFVNDIAVLGNKAYVTVTNTGKIFTLDISAPASLDSSKLAEYVDVVGANGILIDGQTMYVASYPADGVTTADNVIYRIADVASPVVEKVFERAGQYDGLALKGDKLFFTNWEGPEVGSVNLKDKSVNLFALPSVTLTGPADMTLLSDKLYVPNLPSSEVLVIGL